jgi:hypothetical protein
MAITKYAQHVANDVRRSGVMERGEYQRRSRELAMRGQELPQTKLLDLDVVTIKSSMRQREKLREYIRDNLSNDALAKQFGVHRRTIEKIAQCETWSHIA